MKNAKRSLWATLICSVFFVSCQSTQPVSSKPTTSEYLDLANQYAKDGLLREAIQAYRKEIAANPSSSAAHRNLGIVYVKVGDYKKAEKHLEKALPSFDKNYEANFYLAETYRAREKYAEAIFRYKRALEEKPQDPKSLKALAWSYYKIRYYAEALRHANALKNVAPQDNQVSIILARTLLKLERPEKALAVIRKAEALAKPSDLPYLQSVGGDIYRRMDDCNKGLTYYRNALKEQPLLAGALLGLGQCLLKTNGDTAQALTYMERAVRIKPTLAEGHYLLGKVYEKTDRAKSLKHYNQFRKHASVDPEFLSQLPEIRKKIEELSKKN